MKGMVGFIIVFLMGSVAFAQEGPYVQFGLNYSYVRFNPENSGTLNSHSLNGGGGEVSLFFNDVFAFKAEFEGYGSTTTSYRNGSISANASANLFTYNIGPFVRIPISHVAPFVEAMFGGAHSNFYGNLCKEVTCINTSPSNNAFDFIIGGGLDVPLGRHVAFRPA